MIMPRVKVPFIAALAVLVSPALFALDLPQNPTPASPAVPGTLNYIEGATTINGQFLAPNAIGSVTLQPGQEISTSTGRAEVLLTPGVFFRLDHNSSAKMVSPDLTNTVMRLDHGRASVEVDQLFKENDIHVVENNVPVQLLKPGLYEFDADHGTVMVFSGEAAAQRSNGKWVVMKDHHELNVAEGAAPKTVSFNEDAQKQTDLYRWSSLRSDYLAEANYQIAGDYAGGAYAPGWYWDPYMFDYTFLGPWGFYSPFGWGFYPLGWGYGGFYGGRGRGFGPHGVGGFHGDALRAGGSMGGFHGGGFGGGGFHGGGGFGGGHGR
jgi:hypothetical protein